MGKYQLIAMWAVGILLGLGFLGDAIDYFFTEDLSDFSILEELMWTGLFLTVVAACEVVLWTIFTAYNRTFKRT